jgi:2-polyprenyl-6-methoxyphenol hydroxylase-like FAD-dependent oxidoreductase
MNVMDEIEVLVVGAGPTGLSCGCWLAQEGIKFRIIDQV